tara:strand:- start:212 stop:631 length:420 start_codon:yes stop_codon:yes gene_type:complete
MERGSVVLLLLAVFCNSAFSELSTSLDSSADNYCLYADRALAFFGSEINIAATGAGWTPSSEAAYPTNLVPPCADSYTLLTQGMGFVCQYGSNTHVPFGSLDECVFSSQVLLFGQEHCYKPFKEAYYRCLHTTGVVPTV